MKHSAIRIGAAKDRVDFYCNDATHESENWMARQETSNQQAVSVY